jgi:hypothetical protein
LQFLQVQGLQRQPPFVLAQLQSAVFVSIFFSIAILLLSNSGRKAY